MNEVEMAPDELRECVLGPVPGVTRKQFQVCVAHVQKDNVAGCENPPAFLVTSP
jgi:hypothetical protein